jgi:hypothetical protein
MRKLVPIAAVAALLAFSPAALAESTKAAAGAPGQDRVCLVTTGTPDRFNDADVVATKWLPRKAAEAQASKDPGTMRVFDYSKDPLVLNKTYPSAEELCNTHFG